LLSKALDFAHNFRPISKHERGIIIHEKRSLLFSGDCQWGKKPSTNQFDVTMGLFDGAETCEAGRVLSIVPPYRKYGQNIGLYRDDGLAASKRNRKRLKRSKKIYATSFATTI